MRAAASSDPQEDGAILALSHRHSSADAGRSDRAGGQGITQLDVQVRAPRKCALREMFSGDHAQVRRWLEIAKQSSQSQRLEAPKMFWDQQDIAQDRCANDGMFFVLAHMQNNPKFRDRLRSECVYIKAFDAFVAGLNHAFHCFLSGLDRTGADVEKSTDKWFHEASDFVIQLRSDYLKL